MITLQGNVPETVDVSLSNPEVIIRLNLTNYCLSSDCARKIVILVFKQQFLLRFLFQRSNIIYCKLNLVTFLLMNV
jgi:hypothetical protein